MVECSLVALPPWECTCMDILHSADTLQCFIMLQLSAAMCIHQYRMWLPLC